MSDIDILARTIFGEARGEWEKGGLASLIAVGNVVMNRFTKTVHKSISDICKSPWQFSCWNPNDPNLSVIQKVQKGHFLFDQCCYVADKVISNQWPDLTKGATHYFSVYLKTPPVWSQKMIKTVKIGAHIFFKEV